MCGVLFNNVTECKKCPGVGVVCSKMPGANCSLPQCTNSRYVKKEVAEDGIEKTHFFAITKAKEEFFVKWQAQMLQIVKRYRDDVDYKFIKAVEKGQKWFCHLHYRHDDIKYTGTHFLENQLSLFCHRDP